MPQTSDKAGSRFSLRSISRFFLGVVLGMAILALVVFNIVLGWVATGPRDLDTFTPVIESALSRKEHYNVSVGKTQLIWNGWEHPLDIRLQDVAVSTSKKRRFSTFPVVYVGLDLWQLLQGNVLPAELTIERPVISLYQTKERAIQFGVGTPMTPQTHDAPSEDTAEEDDTILPFEVFVAQIIEPPKDSALRKLINVRVVHADVSIGSKLKGVFFKAEKTNLNLRKNRKGIWLSGGTSMTYGRKTADIKADFFLPAHKQIMQGDISFDAITPSALSKLFTHIPELNAIQFPVQGKASLEVTRSGTLNHANIMLKSSQGVIEHPAFESAIKVEGITLDASYAHADNAVTVNDVRIDLGGDAVISGKSTLGLKDGAINTVEGVINTYNIPNDQLARYWPHKISPMSREWVTQNISKGTYTQAQTYISIKEGDLDKDVLPKDAVNARVEVRDAYIKYLPEHPEMEKIDATMFIDAHSLQAVIHTGDFLETTKLSAGHLTIPDLNAENPILDIAFNASASAADIVRFLGLPRLQHAKRLNLDATKVTGSIDGSARVQFHFFAPEDTEDEAAQEDDIKYNVTAQLKDVTQKAIMSDFDVEKANGIITVNNQYIDFVGNGTVNGAYSKQMGVSYRFQSTDAQKTLIQASAVAPVSSLARFGYPGKDYLDGALDVDVVMLTGGEKKQAAVSLGLKQTDVHLTPARYFKPVGMPLKMSLYTDRREGRIYVPLLIAQGDNISALGKFNMDKSNNRISALELSHVQHAKTDLTQLHYKTDGENFSLKMRGKTADMSAWQQEHPAEEKEQKPAKSKMAYVPSVPAKGGSKKAVAEKLTKTAATKRSAQDGFSFQNFPPLSMDIAVDTVVLGKDRELYDVNGKFSCNSTLCKSAHVVGKTADQKSFLFQIMKNPKGRRQLVLHAEGAGDFLRAMDIFQGMYGGDLSITGEYEEQAQGSILTGRIDGTGYVVKDAPVLARLLSVASLTGFFDTLSGKGITFKKMRAPFKLHDDVLTITDGKTFGNAIGMTIEGNIFFPSQEMDLKGTVVPSYSINSVLGHVPLIGDALMGGEGKGVFAASYTIKGPSHDPVVMVNPLSILTPGFLRGLFDVFDAPAKKPEPADEKFKGKTKR